MSWLHNPATGELARIGDGDAWSVQADLWLQPGAAVARPHVHDQLAERFEVITGELGVVVDGQRRDARAGDAAIEVPAGFLHDWWNAGDGVARVRVEVAAVPGAAGRPADRFVAMIEAAWSLGALGRVSRRGSPRPLWLAAIADEYRDVIRFTRPPGAVLAPLAALARRTGHDPLAAELHGATAACAIPEPSDLELSALLAVRVRR
jgi:hypothetical protein